jgi:hypothetical protein
MIGSRLCIHVAQIGSLCLLWNRIFVIFRFQSAFSILLAILQEWCFRLSVWEVGVSSQPMIKKTCLHVYTALSMPVLLAQSLTRYYHVHNNLLQLYNMTWICLFLNAFSLNPENKLSYSLLLQFNFYFCKFCKKI